MRILIWTAGILIGLVALMAVLQTVASERIEVVQLHTVDEGGNTVTTRLWIVDDEGMQYLRGDSGSGWLQRLQQNDTFEVTRAEETRRYTYTLRPGKVERINQLMLDKYTWGDTFFATVLGGREDVLPVELNPVSE